MVTARSGLGPSLDSVPVGDVAIDIRQISRRFGTTHALDGVSIRVAQGEIHALLGPNGAGKTTLLRILTGLVQADAGEILILGTPMEELGFRGFRKLFGLVPSGDRSFYLRLSGFENLLFFGRLIGLRKDRAVDRARECLEAVGLQDAAEKSVGLYSHGMQKRLSVARALLGDPLVLFIDEATHDLDPEGALTVQSLVADSMGQRAAVIWATQRLDEIRGFADHVTLLDRGHVRFDGTVPQLMAVAVPRRYVVQLLGRDGPVALESARAALGALGELEPGQDGDREHFVIHVSDSVTLGDALAAMMAGGISVLACREERSGLENAFLQLVRSDQA